MLVAGHANQRVQRERQLQAEHHLAENQQFADGVVAHQPYAQERRDQRQPAGDQATLPARDAQVEIALHDHLPGDGAGEGRALPGRQQGDAEQDAGEGAAHQWVQQVIGVLDLDHIGVPGFVEGRGGEDQDRRIDQQRQGQRADGVDPGQLHRVLFAGEVFADQPGLYDRAVQVQVVRHHRGPEDADGQVQRRSVADGRQ